MARILDKDPATYGKERDGFVRDLQHFHDTRGTPFRRCPAIGGHEIDLYLLYSLVTAQGGWLKVNARNEWETIFEQFDLPTKCVNSAVALKQIYIRYLDRYEKVHFLGEEADRGSDDDEESRHKRWSARALHAVPLNYNYHQHNIADSTRAYNGLSDNLYKPSDYDRLALSLISPLPNEQDFAVNVCTLLCNEGKHTLKLEKCPRIVDYLLAHTGIFHHCSLRQVFTDVYSKVRKHSLNQFWYDALESHDVLDLTNEDNFISIKKPADPSNSTSPPSKCKTKCNSQPAKPTIKEEPVACSSRTEESQTLSFTTDSDPGSQKCGVSVAVNDSDSDSDSDLFASEQCVSETITNKGRGFKLKLEPIDRELFCTGRSLGTQDYVGQRVLQIANILRNLSFTEENVPVLASNRTFLRFLLLCVSSRWNSIHQLGLDMLSNVASELSVKDQKDRITECIMNFVTKGLHSQDRVMIIACLEILNKLSQKEANEDFMLRSLERKTYAQVCSFLTLHDVMLLIYTLECLYSLSSLGERACNYIVDVHGIIDTLVSLVTVEGKSYGPKACIGMKLVETVPGVVTQTPASTAQTPQQSASTVQTSIQTTVLSTPLRPVQSTTPRNILPAPQKPVMTSIQSPVATPVVQQQPQAQPAQPVTPQQFIQQQHAHQQAIQENEQFALAWLRATYEPCAHGKIEQQELYKQYLNSCAKIGRRGVIAPLHFPRCVRSVFGGTVGPNPMKGADNATLQYYEGIRARIVPLIITLPSATLQQATLTKVTPTTRRCGKVIPTVNTTVLTTLNENSSDPIPTSPASPILKAQLSAPPKPRESPTKVDIKSQVLAHPHLSQALLGSSASNTGTAKEATAAGTTVTASVAGASTGTPGQSNTSLIKSLLATKVNECMSPHTVSMKTTALSPVVHAVPSQDTQSAVVAAQILENHIPPPASLGGGVNSAFRGRREPPQPPPPPLAPLSTNSRAKTPRMDIEDSDSTGNNSVASSTGISSSNVALSGGISSTEDGENSLTSFEGILLNGIPHSIDIDAPCNDDSNSKDSIRNVANNPCKKPLMLADLLEKKVDKDPPILNGVIGKELRIGDKGLELVDNHINKILNKDNNASVESKEVSVIVSSENNGSDTVRTCQELNNSVSACNNKTSGTDVKLAVKRPAEDDISDVEAKKRNLQSPSVIVTNNVNGVDSPKPDSLDSNGDDSGANVSVSATAANLYASLAADVLEDEDEELLQQEAAGVTSTIPPPVVEEPPPQPMQVVQSAPMHQVIAVGGQSDQQQLIRQIIVSQGQIQSGGQQVLITAGGQIALQQNTTSTAAMKAPAGHQTLPMLVQTAAGQQRAPMMLTQSNNAPILVSHGPQGQMQLVTSGSQPGQYVLSAGGAQGQTHYVVAQPQTALVQGQAQTVLVAQTPQQQGTPSKTIIILQPQTTANTATHHQKVVVTPQGQQVVVTQVQRPILQTSTVTNNIPPALVPSTQVQNSANPTLIKTTQTAVITQNITGMVNAAIVQNPTVSGAGNKLLAPKDNKTSRPQTPVAVTIGVGTSSTEEKTVNVNMNPAKVGTGVGASTSQTVTVQPSATIIRDYSNPYICEWRGCTSTKKFKSANEVYMHACEAHCPPTSNGEELQCLWDRCDNMKRKRFSLMTHLHDRHCSPEIMKMMAARRKQLSQSGKTEIPAPAPAPPHPGYAPDAALHAIKRHALEFVNPKELQQKSTPKPGTPAAAVPIRPGTHPPDQDDNEGPVTKSIRLTASLILRNLVIYSNNSRRYLRHYEPHLAGVALIVSVRSGTMASILRSAKFVRYVAGFARNIVINPPREFDGNFIQNTTCLCGGLQRSLATQASAQRPQHDQNLEKSIRRLDNDVRRSGRISRRDIEDILEEIRHTRSATSSQSLLVIRCCGNLVPEELPEIRTKLVQEIWNTLHKLNVPMDISHYNALLRVYLENEHPFSPTEFLTDLEAKGIEPNRVTYQRLIAQYCQLGDIEGATRILEFMREKQLPVNENVFNALIMGHSQTDDMESAKGILSVMQQAGLEPSADTYTTLLCGFARKGDLDSINSTFEECDAKEVYLLDKDYLDIIFSLATNNHNHHVPAILAKVRKSVGYNQDAINLILRLINHGQEETALEILKTVPAPAKIEGQPQTSGNILIRQLVKVKRPASNIIEVCKHLQQNGQNARALLYAAETSLQMADPELAYSLLEELQADGQTVRQHFFWPLIVAKGKAKDVHGLLDVLSRMTSFNLSPSSETVREYVLPYLSGDVDEIMRMLRSAGISTGSAASSIIYSNLIKNNIKDAAHIAGNVPAFYSPALLKRPLTAAFLKTQDVHSYVMLIRRIYDNLERRDTISPREETEENNVKQDIVGSYVLDILYARPKNNVDIIEAVLTGLVEHGLSMTSAMAERIQDRLGEQMTPEVSTLLGKMTSGELTPITLEKTEPHYTPSSAMNIPQLERLITNLEAKKEPTKGLKRQLLTLYTRAKELEKTEALLKSLEADDFQYTNGVYAQLIDLYAHHEKLEETMNYYDKLVSLEPGTALDDTKVMKVIFLLVKNDRFDQAIEMLNAQTRDGKSGERSFAYSALCWRLLNSLAEQGKTEQLKTLFDTLVNNKFVDVNNVLLGPLVKVHIVNNDLEGAMQQFEVCCNQYRSTPWKNELACKLIQSEDAEKLQKLTDLSTNIHGEVNSLYDLVFAFVECGRIRQARKILETPGLQSRPQRLNSACERYREEGLVIPLEGLMEATRDLSHIDRSDIYYQLLLSYIKNGDPDKALGLWTQMQDEDCEPNDQFLKKLGDFLRAKGRDVPFVIPKNLQKSVAKPKDPKQIVETVPKGDVSQFRQVIKGGNIDQAIRMKQKVNNLLNVTDYSLLLEALVKDERQNEATNLCYEMIQKNIYPIPRVFRFFLNKIANNGDVDTMERIGNKLSSDMKKVLSFDNRLCHANIVAGKAGDYLDILMKEIEHARDDQVQILAEKFPRGGAVGILEKCPELTEKYELLAEIYAKRGAIAPMNVLWAQHFINNDSASADRIWNTHLAETPRIMFQRVVQLARETKNETLIARLIEHLKSSKVSEGALGNAYSCLFDVLVALDKPADTINAFEQAVKDLNLEHINRTALLRVKEVYEKSGKPFTHQIPPKNVKSSTSSSSDDDKKH
ncbi:bicoid stability factor [Carabus blaptoides fortunei]